MFSNKKWLWGLGITVGLVIVCGYFLFKHHHNNLFQAELDRLNTSYEIITKENQEEYTRHEKSRREHLIKISQAFQQDRCDDFLSMIGFDDLLTDKSDNLLLADLYMRGKCVEQDFAKAYDLLKASLSALQKRPHPDYAHTYDKQIVEIQILARLATLYWNGLGVPLDQAKATKLMQRANLFMVPDFLLWKRSLGIYDLPDMYEAWNENASEMMLRLMRPETGPWDIPEPFIADLKGWEDLLSKGPAELYQIALNLKNGGNGYERDIFLAHEWLFSISLYYQHTESDFDRAQLLEYKEMVDIFYEIPIDAASFYVSGDPKRAREAALNLYIKAASEGEPRAISKIIELIAELPPYELKEDHMAFWMYKARVSGIHIDEQTFEEVWSVLTDVGRQSIMKHSERPEIAKHYIPTDLHVYTPLN